MRLLIVSQYFWPENFRVNELVATLVQRGHEVTVLTALPNYPEGSVFPEYAAAPGQFARYEGAEVVRVPFAPRGQGAPRLILNYATFVASASTIGAWRLRGRHFDVVFVFQPSPVTSCLPALVIARLKRAPVILWTLDLWPETLQAIGVVRSPLLLSLVGQMVRFIYRRCVLVLGQSRAFAGNVERYAGASDRFRYFPQWSESLFSVDPSQVVAADEMRAYQGTFNVLFAGNIGDAQDFPAILDAAERLKHRADVRWLVVGNGRAAPWVRDEIVRRGLTDRVALLGRHAPERMPAFFKGASALLVSLKRAPVFALTIPAKVQAYLASGLPLLGMLDGEGARVIEEAQAGLTCAAGDGAALAGLVERMSALSAIERAAMGGRGLQYARREFDRERLVTQLEGWLRRASAPAGIADPS
ncbi:MAG: glycosyltransferase family 4 protein [Gemmatimonadota bacterium]